jgi:hypothetical protein
MKNLFIQRTENSPEVVFNKEDKVFQMLGESCMSDANLFYAPVIDWIQTYDYDIAVEVKFNFCFSTISQSSMKMLLFVCQEIKSLQIDECKVHVSWCFSKSTKELKEIGQDISYMTELEFDYVLEEESELV